MVGEVVKFTAPQNQRPVYTGPCLFVPYIKFLERRAPQLEAEARKNLEAGKVIFDQFLQQYGLVEKPKRPVS